MIASGDSSPGEHCNFISASRESWPCARRSCGSDCSEASSCFPGCDEVRFLCFALGLGARSERCFHAQNPQEIWAGWGETGSAWLFLRLHTVNSLGQIFITS